MANSLTRGDLVTIVQEYARAGGVSYIDVNTDSTGLRGLINRGLKDFTRWAFCLYATAQTLTTSGGILEYSAEPMFWVETVTVNGSLLRNREGTIGPESRHYIYQTFPDYQTASNGTPRFWVPLPNMKVMLYPKPDQGYSCYLSGFTEHPTITTASSGDSSVLSIEDHVIDLAALWCGQKLKFPHIEGDDVFSKILTLDQYAAKRLDEYRSTNQGRLVGFARRGRGVRRFCS